MHIKVNGDADIFPENSTIGDIISAKTLQEDIVVVFLNGEMVGSERWSSVAVRSDDRLEIIKVVGGG